MGFGNFKVGWAELRASPIRRRLPRSKRNSRSVRSLLRKPMRCATIGRSWSFPRRIRNFGPAALQVTMTSLTFTNCLFVDTAPGLWQDYGQAKLTLDNCTAFRGYLFADNTSGGYWPVTIINCAFDSTTFFMYASGPTNGYCTDYNSFLLNSNATLYLGGHDITNIVSYNWQSSWFGNYYLPSDSPLIDKGSTTADRWNVSFYHPD